MSEAEPVLLPENEVALPVRPAIPAWSLVVIAVISVQIGAAVAKQLFEVVGPPGVVFLRTSLSGVFFMLLWRPHLRGYTRREYGAIVLYGVVIALNMLMFYAAINYVPLGVAVAVAFAGPLGIAVWNSRRLLDGLWIALAALGIFLLSPLTNVTFGPLGMIFALLTALSWGIYIIVTKRVGHILPGSVMLTYAMFIAALVALPLGLGGAAKVLEHPDLIVISLIVALLSSAIPFGLEFQAAKHLSAYAFGLLLSVEPVVAAIVGFVVLGEALGVGQIIGISLVTIAAVATARSSSKSA